jgi:hypothetical protein
LALEGGPSLSDFSAPRLNSASIVRSIAAVRLLLSLPPCSVTSSLGHVSPELSSYCADYPVPEQRPPWQRAKEPAHYLGGVMLREIVIEEETPSESRTTFRLRVDGNVIAENVTELESQFLEQAASNLNRLRIPESALS